MPFLQDTDYEVQIRTWVKQIIIQRKTDVLHQAELAAQAEMESYLRERYNVAKIFAATGDDRNALIVLYMIDIALYHLHSNISADNIPELRIIRYNAAKDWLKDVAKGNISPDLPEKEVTDGTDTGQLSTEFGSRPKYSERY
ncbi:MULTISPECIES: phage protein Gp36 family protein [Elizabethkingia]|jgi:phage gp36-like protein|uniref:phage protein Gp36 family protein n=1 Tax=Elizabethkingia TaxID=308865 RepID=UPI001177B559|nr:MULTISPECIES: phage protein Gp36 family protein [Elizabethkingia]